MKALVHRQASTDQGTTGLLELFDDNNACILTLYTMELPSRNNLPGISDILPGSYTGRWLVSDKHPQGKYHILDAPGRDAIEIHSGNFGGDVEKGWQSDVEGCLLLGGSIGTIPNKFGNPQLAVEGSIDAVEKFEKILNKQDFSITILESLS